jgi:type IV pilus assembly protein PilE
MSRRRSGASGFTLIELMTVAAVVAILAVIAMYSYLSAQRKGNRSAAEAFLASLAQQEQQYFIDNRGYQSCAEPIASGGCLGLATPSNVTTYYKFKVDVDNTQKPPIFTATATPITGTYQVQDTAGTLTIDNTGAKTPAGVW